MLVHLYFISTLICLFCLYSSISWLREPVVTLSDLLFFLGQCVYVLSSCCDIVPLAWLSEFLTTKKEQKKVCLMCAGQPKQLFLFLLENFPDSESNVFTWGINFYRRCGIHTHNLVFSLCCQPVLLEACIACPWVIRNLLITPFDKQCEKSGQHIRWSEILAGNQWEFSYSFGKHQNMISDWDKHTDI